MQKTSKSLARRKQAKRNAKRVFNRLGATNDNASNGNTRNTRKGRSQSST